MKRQNLWEWLNAYNEGNDIRVYSIYEKQFALFSHKEPEKKVAIISLKHLNEGYFYYGYNCTGEIIEKLI